MHYKSLNENEEMQFKLNDFFFLFKYKKAVKFPSKCLRDADPTLTVL